MAYKERDWDGYRRRGEGLQHGMLSKEKECTNGRESKFWSRVGKIAQTDPHSFVCRTNARKQPCNEINVSNFRFNLLILCFLCAAEGTLGKIKENISVRS